MNRSRRNSRRPDSATRQAAEDALREDLRALHTASERDLPTIESTARILQASRAGHNPGGFLMSIFNRFQARPWPATAVAAVVLAAILLFVPISYQKTVAHDATLTLAVPGLDLDQVKKIAAEFKTALHVDGVSITQEAGSGAVLIARVSSRSASPVARVAQAFAEGLSGRGIPATAQVTPRVERVLGSVYAYALDNIINIQVTSDGKTTEQIAAEIRDKLEAAGVENPMVEYRQEGDQTSLMIQMEKSCAPGEDSAACCPQVNVTVDGLEPGGDGTSGEGAQIRVPRTAEMTDEEVIAEVERQLREQGVEAEVTMEEGRIVVHRRNP